MPKTIKDLSQKIKDTARETFIERGFDKTDMRYIAKRLNIAVGTLYNYYPSKTELFNECLTKIEYEMNELMKEHDFSQKVYPQNIKEILTFIFRQANNAFGIWKAYIEMVTADKEWNSNKIGNIKLPSMDYFTSLISKIITKNTDVEKLKLKPEIIARTLLMTVIGLLIDGGDASNEETIEATVDIMLKI